MFLLKNKYHDYYAYKGRKVSKKISLSKKDLLEKTYNDFSYDSLIIEYHKSEMLSNKIIFPENYKKINLEIGFGNGEFLIKNAISKPEELFIGVEVYLNGIAKVLKTISDFKLTNILLSNLNCSYFLPAISDKSVDRIFIINPDPWTKKRHHKRRLISYKIIKLLKQIIKTKDSIFITTDSESYLKDIKNLLSSFRETFGDYTVNIMAENDELYGISRYQRKAIEIGGKIYLLKL